MKKFFKEFKTFITKGNIVDMSVGVIVGSAFTAIVNALSNNILKPIINFVLALITGNESLSDVYTYLRKVEVDGKIDLEQSIYIDWGAFINAVINFILIAFVLFCIVKAINKMVAANEELKNMEKRISFKQEHKMKLTKKEVKFLEEQEKLAKEKAEEDEALAALPPKKETNELLEDILKELQKKND